jgi:hypothetical protein
MPYFGVPGGYGILQHDPPDSPEETWSWRSTILGWQGLVQAKAGPETDTSATSPNDQHAYAFWIRQVVQWQRWNNVDHPDRPIPWVYDPSQDTYPNCSFLPPALNTQTVRRSVQPYWYGDAILMKQIGGASSQYVSWNNNDVNNPLWSFNKPNSVSQDIVLGFCSCGSGKSSCKPGY